MAAQDLLFLRDLAEVEPPRDKYQHYGEEDIYRYVPRPQWTGLDDEIWTPRNQESDPQLEKVKALMKKQSAEDVGLEAQLSGEEALFRFRPVARSAKPTPTRGLRACTTAHTDTRRACAPTHTHAHARPSLFATTAASRFASKLVRKHKKNPKVKIRKLIDHKITEFFMFLFTIWALLTTPCTNRHLPQLPSASAGGSGPAFEGGPGFTCYLPPACAH